MCRCRVWRACLRELTSDFASTQAGGDGLSRHRRHVLLLLLLRLLAAG